MFNYLSIYLRNILSFCISEKKPKSHPLNPKTKLTLFNGSTGLKTFFPFTSSLFRISFIIPFSIRIEVKNVRNICWLTIQIKKNIISILHIGL